MKDSRKQAVSIRMNTADVRKVKLLAQRLGARDSDVIRFAVKGMLDRLAPLHDPQVKGRGLLPVFVESGIDLVRFFELDANRLESLFNEGVDSRRRVDHDDVVLIAMTGAQLPYAALLLNELNRGDDSARPDGAALADALRTYLYEKYLGRAPVDERAAPGSPGNALNPGEARE